VIRALNIKDGLDIYIDGRVPLGAGLSSLPLPLNAVLPPHLTNSLN
jgi:galactokinase